MAGRHFTWPAAMATQKLQGNILLVHALVTRTRAGHLTTTASLDKMYRYLVVWF